MTMVWPLELGPADCLSPPDVLTTDSCIRTLCPEAHDIYALWSGHLWRQFNLCKVVYYERICSPKEYFSGIITLNMHVSYPWCLDYTIQPDHRRCLTHIFQHQQKEKNLPTNLWGAHTTILLTDEEKTKADRHRGMRFRNQIAVSAVCWLLKHFKPWYQKKHISSCESVYKHTCMFRQPIN